MAGLRPIRGLRTPARIGAMTWSRRGEQGGDGAGGGWRNLVAPGLAWLDDEVLAAELAQVVSRLAGRVAGLPGHPADPGGELGGGEAVRCGRQGQCGRQGSTDPGLAQVDAADAGGADPGGQRQLIQGAVGDEADVGAIQGGGEPVSHSGQPGDDLREVLQAAAAAQLPGVVHGGLQAQDVLAFGIGLQLEQPEANPEPGQAY